MKKCSTSPAIKEMQIKSTLRFHLTPIRMIMLNLPFKKLIDQVIQLLKILAENRRHPWYITHIRSHTGLLGLIASGSNQQFEQICGYVCEHGAPANPPAGPKPCALGGSTIPGYLLQTSKENQKE